VKAFVGQTRSGARVEQLRALGIGEMTMPDEYPPRRTPWVLDNGAYKAWKNKLPFNEREYEFALGRWSISPRRALPEFIAIPDVVANREATLALARVWINRIRSIIWPRVAPLAFVVQDGMEEQDVQPFLRDVEVIFVGGSTKWKWWTARRWVAFAHANGKHLHIGRVGTARLARGALDAGADSIDSAFPLWSCKHLEEFVMALREYQPNQDPSPQLGLFAGAANDNSDSEESAC